MILLGVRRHQGLRLGIGLGAGKDFSNVGSLLGRIAVSYDAPRWKAGGNLLLEKGLCQ